MPQDATKVRIEKPTTAAGAVFLAPAGTALPTDATTALNVAFKGVGYVQPDGITETPTRQSSPVYAFGGDQVASAETQDGWTIEFIMIESNAASLAAYFGAANVTAGPPMVIKATAAALEHQVLVLETISGGVKSRRVYPDTQATGRGAIVSKDDAPRAYPITFSAYPDATGCKRYEYIA